MSDKTVNVSLKRFDFKSFLTKPVTALMIGKRNTGKSVLVADMLYYLSKTNMPRACVFSATEESNRFFCKHVPDTFIFDDRGVEQKLEKIVQTQKELFIQRELGHIPKSTDLRISIVLDDMGADSKVLGSDILKYIFMNGRHYDITVIVALQHIMQLKVALRSNTDLIVCLKEGNTNVVRNLYENFFGMFEKPAHFKNAFKACTKNYGCLVLDNLNSSTDVEDVVKWYKATPGRKFRLGSKEFWAYHDERYVSVKQRYLNAQEEKRKREKSTTVSNNGDFVLKKRNK